MLFKRFVVALLCVVFSMYASAGDTSTVIKLNNQANRYMLSDPHLAMQKLEEALQMSRENSDISGEMLTGKNLGELYLKQKKFKESLYYFKRSLHIAESTYNAKETAILSHKTGMVYNLKGDRENALFYLDKATRYYTLASDSEGLHDTYRTLSLVYQSHNEYYQALHYGLEALKISRNFDDKEKLVLSLGNLGQIYSLLNQSQKALEHFLQAISIAEKGDATPYLPILYINAGTLYREVKSWTQSINYLLKAYDLFSKFENNDGMIASLTEIGNTYRQVKQNQKALNYYLRAKTIAEQDNNIPRIIALNKEISDLHIQQKKFHNALVYLDQNFNLAKELGDSKQEAEAIFNIGNYYLLTGKNAKAVELLTQSYLIARQTANPELISKISEHLSTAHYKIGQLDKAYDFLKISKKNIEKFHAEQENNTFSMLQSVFEVANTERELELLRKTNEIERLEKQRARTVQKRLMFGIVALIFLMIVLVYVISLIRRKNRILKIKGLEIEASNLALLEMNISLEKQKSELNKLNISLRDTNQLLKESEERFRSLSATKDKLFSVISHDLRSPFSSVISFVRLLKRDIHKLSKDEISKLADDLEETSNRIHTLLENLLQWSMVQTGRIAFTPDKVNIFDVLSENIQLFTGYSVAKKIQILNNIPQNTFVFADKSMLSAIIRNLLSNAIKFSNPDSEVIVSCAVEENEFVFYIQDGGKGIDEEQLQKLLLSNSPVSTPGSENERGAGLGLLICQEFLHRHSSELNVVKSKKTGSVFYFKLITTEDEVNEA